MNLTKDTKGLLVASGITEPIYRSHLPDGADVPDDVIVLYEYAVRLSTASTVVLAAIRCRW